MADPHDPGGGLPPIISSSAVPPAAVFVTVASNESGMETDGSLTSTTSRPLKRSRSRKVCKHCNKHKRKGHNSLPKSTTDCCCSDNEIAENSANKITKPAPYQFVTPPIPQQSDKVVPSSVEVPTFVPVGRKLYEDTDIAPYVVHVQKEQSSISDGTILHPITFGKFLKRHCIQNIVNGSVKRIGRNRISLAFYKHTDANNFLNHCSLAENCLKVFIPSFNVTRMGLVRGVPTEWSPEEVLENISVPVGCGKILKVRRLNYKVTIEGAPVWKPSQTVVITFDGQVLPKRIFMCYNALTCQLYIYPSIQCYRCCRYGHTKAQCRSNPRCFKCGEGHTGDTCQVDDDKVKCCLCYGNHYSTDKSCPEFVRQKNIKQTMAESCISYAEACKLHPPIFRSYSETLKSAFQQEPKSVHYKPLHPNTTSYTKTVYSKPRAPYVAPKGYDKVAHNQITKDYNMPPPPNGCALTKTDNIQEQSLSEIITALILTLTQYNIPLPSNVAPFIDTHNLRIHNYGHNKFSQNSPVELPQRS